MMPAFFSFMELTFAGWSWLGPALGVSLLALTILAWSYRSRGPLGIRLACLVLKLLGIAALALCLLEPLRTGQRARPGANLFAVVADNSQGLQIKDAGQTAHRGDRLKQWLEPIPGGWQNELAESFEIRRFLFDSRLQGVTDFAELNFDGRYSSILTSLRTLSERMKGRPLAGVLLFTDGNATDLPPGGPDLTGLPPVYPVVVGEKLAVQDISIAQVAVSQSAFEDQPIAIQGEVQAPGFRGQRVTTKLRDPAGKVVTEETQVARNADGTVPFRFNPRPEEPGVVFYELSTSLSTDATTLASGATNTSQEATLINNSKVIAVDRGRGPYRILYVSGRPNWEFKFLRRAIDEDPQLRLSALIRVAKREPKFEFRGRAGETSNPLFRGFGNQSTEEVERYDRPVLVRLNAPGEAERSHEFPNTEEELYRYQAIILDDIEAGFFTPAQAALVQRFVSERGGGLLMLGGMECYCEGGYHRTPIGDLLPVYLDRTETPATQTPVHFDLAREGWLQPWARLRDTEADERLRLDGMPAFAVANRVRGVKPGASVIATGRDEAGQTIPALAIQRFGRGRTGALLIGDLWRWGMRDPSSREDMDKAWRQWVRWFVAEVPTRVDLTVEPIAGDALGSVQLQVRVRDAKFAPLDTAAVTVEVTPVVFGTNAVSDPDKSTNTTIRLRAEPSTTEAGMYQATFLPRGAGGFSALAVVTNDLGAEVGRDQSGWASDPAAEEFRSLQPNLSLLQLIASKTGGTVLTMDELPGLVKKLPTERAPIMESWSYPAWHTATVFGFALACFITEWGLRRWKGLP